LQAALLESLHIVLLKSLSLSTVLDIIFLKAFLFQFHYSASVVEMSPKLVFSRHLLDVCLQQNITADIDMLANSLAKVVIVNILNGIPTKHEVFFSFHVFIVLL